MLTTPELSRKLVCDFHFFVRKDARGEAFQRATQALILEVLDDKPNLNYEEIQTLVDNASVHPHDILCTREWPSSFRFWRFLQSNRCRKLGSCGPFCILCYESMYPCHGCRGRSLVRWLMIIDHGLQRILEDGDECENAAPGQGKASLVSLYFPTGSPNIVLDFS